MEMIQSVREIPGFLALLAVYVMLVVREHRLSALSIMALGVAVGATGLFPTFAGLCMTTLIGSFGFHYYETTNQSITLQYFEKHQAPWVFGKQRSRAAATNIAVGLAILGLSAFLTYWMMYLLEGLLICAAAVWGLFQNPTPRNLTPQRKQMV